MNEYQKIRDAYLSSINNDIDGFKTLSVEPTIIEETKKEIECFKLFVEQLFLKRFKEIRFLIDDEKQAQYFDNIIKENVKNIIESSFKNISNFSTKEFYFW